ncbi:hypothetical protein L2719_05165 [Shewanella schlegeliana]|uniref:Uncharacterized protein n=1 Tax=Shewanella schlegeliana TaxID=190308 RepID=A0ABS1SWT4_9GAMM|nr:hypothetical protein [Shewanella schlegeliana]MBL4912967.1 hypothetical protein [Shewanella schlegeliana]MCL1108937.1 hypothetical protein [Shewanella schlegeliana]
MDNLALGAAINRVSSNSDGMSHQSINTELLITELFIFERFVDNLFNQ